MENECIKNWRRVIDGFFIEKKQAESAKVIKSALDKLKKENSDQQVQEVLKQKKAKEVADHDFQINRFQSIKTILQQQDKLSHVPDISERMLAIEQKFEPNSWITKAATKAPGISFATHVAKLTHSSSKATSILDESEEVSKDTLTTSALRTKQIDGVLNNADAPYYQFLELELDGQKLVTALAQPENKILACYAGTEDQLTDWNDGFAESIKPRKILSDQLIKQVYFPIDEKRQQYHLLCNLVSSSLAHAIFENSKLTKQARDRRKAEKFSQEIAITFPRRTSLYVTQSNHGNASQLNGKRGGRLILSSCEPPLWNSQLKPPIFKKSFFYALYSPTAIRGLNDLLSAFEQAGISFKQPQRLDGINKWVKAIFDEVLDYVSDIQMLEPSWSAQDNVALKSEHQYLLDCYRSDTAFIEARQKCEWQSVIVSDFALWLNAQIKKINKKFTNTQAHHRQWKRVAEPMLRDYVDGLVFPQIADSIVQNNEENADA